MSDDRWDEETGEVRHEHRRPTPAQRRFEKVPAEEMDEFMRRYRERFGIEPKPPESNPEPGRVE